eukprot:g1720.t1
MLPGFYGRADGGGGEIAITDAERLIVLFLSTRDVIALLSASKTSRAGIAADAKLWHGLLARDFRGADGQMPGVDFDGGLESIAIDGGADALVTAYRRWQALVARVGGGMFAGDYVRSCRAWDALRCWLRENQLEDVGRTLKPGLTATALAAVDETAQSTSACQERASAANLALASSVSALKAVYSVVGGQLLGPQGAESGIYPDGSARPAFNGVFGCHSVYQDLNVTHFTHQRAMDKAYNNPHVDHSGPEQLAVECIKIAAPGASATAYAVEFAHGTDGSIVCQDVASGALLRANCEYREGGLIVSFAKPVIVPQQYPGRGVGALGYLEEYVARLRSGYYRAASIFPDAAMGLLDVSRGINLFPDASGAVSVAVTRGVEIRASVVFLNPARCPAECLDMSHDAQFPQRQSQFSPVQFAYSFRMRLLGAGAGDVPQQCQLQSRRLLFTDGAGRTRTVEGAAVVGKLPLLRDGGYVDLGVDGAPATGEFVAGEFVYQSQTGPVEGTEAGVALVQGGIAITQPQCGPLDMGAACIRGSMRFVPGSIDDPQGPAFDAEVAPISFPDRIDLFG